MKSYSLHRYLLIFFFLSAFASRPILADGTAGLKVAIPGPSRIKQACQATQYPQACESMLSGKVKKRATTSQIIQAAIVASAQNLGEGRAMLTDIISMGAKTKNSSTAAQTCLISLSMSEHRTFSAYNALVTGTLRDARAWESASLWDQYNCWSELNVANDTDIVNQTLSFFHNSLIVSTSNALSMMRAFSIYGPKLKSWANPPNTERQGFWEPIVKSSVNSPKFNFSGLKANAVVCKNNSTNVGCYATVQAAVDAAPKQLKGDNRFVIAIKAGVYHETVRVLYNKTNLVFIGDGVGKTVITGNLSSRMPGIFTYESATVGVLGDGFMANGITFENTASPPTSQAIAFRSSSDKSYLENCEFLGNQNTLCAHSLRQFYKFCLIVGNIDPIFGNAAAIFQNCSVLIRPRQGNPQSCEQNTVAAHGRIDPAQTTGFVFIDSLINGTADYMNMYNNKPKVHLNYLGRPWKKYSRIVYISCIIGSFINPKGWVPMNGDYGLSTLYFGEFGNKNDGANLRRRVPWSSKIPKNEVATYYFSNFVDGEEWVTRTL